MQNLPKCEETIYSSNRSGGEKIHFSLGTDDDHPLFFGNIETKRSGTVFTNRFKNVSSLVFQIFVYNLRAFECNTTYDWLNHVV